MIKLSLVKAFLNVKIWATVVLLQVQWFSEFIMKYLVGDIGFVKWLTLAMLLDLLTGLAKAYRLRQPITSKGLRDSVGKVIQYGAFLIITHILTHFEINGQVQYTNLEWLNKAAFEFVILIEIKSVYENVVAINKKFDFVSTMWSKLVKFFPVKEVDKK